MSKTLMDRIEAGREFRSIKLECRKSEDDKSFIVEGYASTFGEEYKLFSGESTDYVEVVDRNAFASTDMSDVIFQYDHEGRVFARGSNGTLKVEPDEHGLKVIADLGGTEEGRKLYQEIRDGYTNKMSFGFTVRGETESWTKQENGRSKYTRTITDVEKLYDVSAVSLPANDGTEISARRLRDGANARHEAERLQQTEKEAMTVESESRARKLSLMKLHF